MSDLVTLKQLEELVLSNGFGIIHGQAPTAYTVSILGRNGLKPVVIEGKGQTADEAADDAAKKLVQKYMTPAGYVTAQIDGIVETAKQAMLPKVMRDYKELTNGRSGIPEERAGRPSTSAIVGDD